jgi:hypothetical protein
LGFEGVSTIYQFRALFDARNVSTNLDPIEIVARLLGCPTSAVGGTAAVSGIDRHGGAIVQVFGCRAVTEATQTPYRGQGEPMGYARKPARQVRRSASLLMTRFRHSLRCLVATV